MQLVTTSQQAQMLGVSKAFLERDRLDPCPRIPFVRVGKRAIRYDPIQVRETLASGQADAAPAIA